MYVFSYYSSFENFEYLWVIRKIWLQARTFQNTGTVWVSCSRYSSYSKEDLKKNRNLIQIKDLKKKKIFVFSPRNEVVFMWTHFLSAPSTVDFQWRVYESHVEGLAPGPLQLLAVRRVADWAALRSPRRASVLRQVLRDGLRQYLRRLQPHHWNRLKGKKSLIVLFVLLK